MAALNVKQDFILSKHQDLEEHILHVQSSHVICRLRLILTLKLLAPDDMKTYTMYSCPLVKILLGDEGGLVCTLHSRVFIRYRVFKDKCKDN